MVIKVGGWLLRWGGLKAIFPNPCVQERSVA